jgi:hypothetical protein
MSAVCGVFDSGVAAAWAAAGGTFLATVVAFWQLGRFNKNAESANSLKLLDDYDRSREIEANVSFSPQSAFALLQAMALSAGFPEHFRAIMVNRQSFLAAGDVDVLRVSNAIMVFANYLVMLHDAIAERLVSKKFIYSKLSRVIWEGVGHIETLRGRPSTLQLATLAQDARCYWDAMPTEARESGWFEADASASGNP